MRPAEINNGVRVRRVRVHAPRERYGKNGHTALRESRALIPRVRKVKEIGLAYRARAPGVRVYVHVHEWTHRTPHPDHHHGATMNGPDHYRTAQDLSRRTDKILDSHDHDATDCIAVGIAGLLHAVLAVASAIVDTAPNEVEFLEDWARAEGETR